MLNTADLSREQLTRLLEVFAKNWLAHDGCWFLAAEEKLGMDAAIELDAKAWERFAVVEARRIVEAFDIPPNGGVQALERALGFRMYALINRQETQWTGDGALEFRMAECRVQQARRRKGLPDFPCKPVGTVEFSRFAETVDPRIRTECLACPPDPVGDGYCAWRFRVSGEEPRR
ncbi:MAG: hypothetical protein FJW35_06985 [Acidobacteria bacterium]|nr:hypothetical protein [Acidobacteriota bacterium]